MEVESMFKTAVEEIERMLNTKSVIGEPITVEGFTLIPMVALGFGFGAGGGEGSGGSGKGEAAEGEGKGGGTGGGGGVRPVAIAVIGNGQVNIVPIGSGATSVMEKIVETLGDVASNVTGNNKDQPEDTEG